MLGILIVCSIIISVPTVLFPIVASTNLKWSLDVGDSFVYHIVVDGWELNYTESYHEHIPTVFMKYDGLYVIAEIVSLPFLGFYLNGDDFKQVIDHQKVHVVFENGSEIPTEVSNMAESMISRCVLPIGGWQLIDWFYPDIPASFPYPPIYTSSSSDTSFHFGYDSLDIDLTTRLRGDISFDDGIPSKISYYRSHGLDYAFNITLTLIEN